MRERPAWAGFHKDLVPSFDTQTIQKLRIATMSPAGFRVSPVSWDVKNVPPPFLGPGEAPAVRSAGKAGRSLAPDSDAPASPGHTRSRRLPIAFSGQLGPAEEAKAALARVTEASSTDLRMFAQQRASWHRPEGLRIHAMSLMSSAANNASHPPSNPPRSARCRTTRRSSP